MSEQNEPLHRLAARWDRDAAHYLEQIQECQQKGLDYDNIDGTRCAIRLCAHELRQVLKKMEAQQ